MNVPTLSQYLKHSRWFRALSWLPLLIRRRIRERGNTATEIYCRVVVGGQVILSPQNMGGRFRMSAVSDLAKWVITTGVFEPEKTGVLERIATLKGDIINVGANVGLYAVFFARKFENVRRIYAIEPNPEAYVDLEWNIQANGFEGRIRAIQMCISDTSGDVSFSRVPGMPEYSSIGRIAHAAVGGREQEVVRVPAAPLDDVFRDETIDPVLVFIDVEGAELLVLKGAERILKERGPIIMFECDDSLMSKFCHSSKLLEEYLSSIGFVVRNAFAPRLPLVHPFVGEAVAFPRNKLEWVQWLSPSCSNFANPRRSGQVHE